MMARKALASVAAAIALFACASEPPRAPRPPASSPRASTDLRFDVGALDRTQDPCADFYQYACGGWQKAHPIPPDHARWSRYAEMEAENLGRVRAIVEGAARGGANATSASQRVGAYYAACMDERAIEARGVTPLHEILGRIDGMRAAAEILDVTAELHAHHVGVLFDAYAKIDPHDARQTILGLDRGSLGLAPDDYEGAKGAELRARYREHLRRVFAAIGSTDPGAEAERVLAFEASLAKRALSAVERRNPDARTHLMTIAELGTRYGAIAWPTYLARIGVPGVTRVNVAEIRWLEGVNEAVARPDLAALRSYFRARLVRKFALVLPRVISETIADFDLRTLRGAKEVPPRWKRCLSLVDAMLGDDVGRVFLGRHFTEDAARRARSMVEALRKAFEADIASLDWMSEGARKAALAKLARVLVVVGGSNRLQTYDGLVMRADDAFGDTWRARAHASRVELSLIGEPHDRERFFDQLPHNLDAFSASQSVAVGFTAGFLQPPVFDPRLDDAVNFGGLGAVMGHELSHQFDDHGRKYDVEGNLHPWWSKEDVARFEERARCFVDEYARFRTDEGTPIDGKLTLGENIADNGGLRLAYAALQPSFEGPKTDGFTPAQRFFLAWGQIRCENVTPEAQRRRARHDSHAPGRARVNGVVSNMPEFARAFSCGGGAAMAPARRCRMW
jgi:putative endopeptidase